MENAYIWETFQSFTESERSVVLDFLVSQQSVGGFTEEQFAENQNALSQAVLENCAINSNAKDLTETKTEGSEGSHVSVSADSEDLISLESQKTTLMIRNVPKKYTKRALLSEISNTLFLNKFDFFYLPTDISSGRNLGYAFVNFISASDAAAFKKFFHKKQLQRNPSRAGLSISFAAVQGLEANLRNLKSNTSIHRIKNPEYLPLVGLEKSSNSSLCAGLVPYQVDPSPVKESKAAEDTDASTLELPMEKLQSDFDILSSLISLQSDSFSKMLENI